MCVGGYKEFSLTYSKFYTPSKISVDISRRTFQGRALGLR